MKIYSFQPVILSEPFQPNSSRVEISLGDVVVFTHFISEQGQSAPTWEEEMIDEAFRIFAEKLKKAIENV